MRYAMLVVALVVGCGSEVQPVSDGGSDDAAPVGDSGPECEGRAPVPTFVCCDGEWIDPINDVENCGACGVACDAEQTCRIGRCE